MNRKILEKKRIQIFGVGGLFVNQKGEILLTKRIEPLFQRWDGKWGIPGGHIEFGEDPKQTLRRELKEELGVDVKIIKNNPFVASCKVSTSRMICHGILICYLCKIKNGKPKRSSTEHSDLKYFSPESIDFNSCIPSTEDFVRQYKSLKN